MSDYYLVDAAEFDHVCELVDAQVDYAREANDITRVISMSALRVLLISCVCSTKTVREALGKNGAAE